MAKVSEHAEHQGMRESHVQQGDAHPQPDDRARPKSELSAGLQHRRGPVTCPPPEILAQRLDPCDAKDPGHYVQGL